MKSIYTKLNCVCGCDAPCSTASEAVYHLIRERFGTRLVLKKAVDCSHPEHTVGQTLVFKYHSICNDKMHKQLQQFLDVVTGRNLRIDMDTGDQTIYVTQCLSKRPGLYYVDNA